MGKSTSRPGAPQIVKHKQSPVVHGSRHNSWDMDVGSSSAVMQIQVSVDELIRTMQSFVLKNCISTCASGTSTELIS